jgi:hypothetical protein
LALVEHLLQAKRTGTKGQTLFLVRSRQRAAASATVPTSQVPVVRVVLVVAAATLKQRKELHQAAPVLLDKAITVETAALAATVVLVDLVAEQMEEVAMVLMLSAQQM